jgi:hypothetical protein
MSVILGTSEAKIRRIVFPGQPGQIVHETAHLQNGDTALSSNPSPTRIGKKVYRQNSFFLIEGMCVYIHTYNF